MELWQAALIGLFAYLGRNQVPWLCGTTGGWYGIGRPLVAGLICGVILGDVAAGVLCGVAVQAIFIGAITPGGAVPSDLNLAAFIGIPLAIVGGGTAEMAVALAIPLGALGVALHNFTMTFNAIWPHRADKCAAAGDAKGVRTANLCGQIIQVVERISIVTLACYLGAGFVEGIFQSLPPIVTDWLAIGGKMLPALGFAILLNQIVQEKWMIALFVLGWVLVASFGLTTTSLLFVALALALIYVMARYSGGSQAGAASLSPTVVEDADGNYEER